MSRLDELKDKLEKLCREYDEYGVLVLVDNIDSGLLIAGSLCKKCAAIALVMHCVSNNIEHNDPETRFEDFDKKDTVN